MREFSSPSGRHWIASIFHFPSAGTGLAGEQPPIVSGSVLRFRTDDVTLDLADWPDDWWSMSTEQLLQLLRRATTPSFPPLRYCTPLGVPVQPDVR